MNATEGTDRDPYGYGQGDAALFEAFEHLRPRPDAYARALRDRLASAVPEGSEALEAEPDERSPGGRARPPEELQRSFFRETLRRAATWLPPVLLPASLARAAGVTAVAAAKTKAGPSAAAWILGLPGLVILFVLSLGLLGLRATRRFEATSLGRWGERPKALARIRRRIEARHGGLALLAGTYSFLATAVAPASIPSWSIPVVVLAALGLTTWLRHRRGFAEREVLLKDARRIFGNLTAAEVLLVAFAPGMADPTRAVAALCAYLATSMAAGLGGSPAKTLDLATGPLTRVSIGVWFLVALRPAVDSWTTKWEGLLAVALLTVGALALRGLSYGWSLQPRVPVVGPALAVGVYVALLFGAEDRLGRVAEWQAERWVLDQTRATERDDIQANEVSDRIRAIGAAKALDLYPDRRPETRAEAVQLWRETVWGQTIWATALDRGATDTGNPTDGATRAKLVEERALQVADDKASLELLRFAVELIHTLDPSRPLDRLRERTAALLRERFYPATNTWALRSCLPSSSENLDAAWLIRELEIYDAIDVRRFRDGLGPHLKEPRDQLAWLLLRGVELPKARPETLWARDLPAGLILLVSLFAALIARRAPAIRLDSAAG